MTLFKVGQKQQIRSFRSLINQPIIFIFHSDLVKAKDKYPRNLLTSQDRKQLFSAIKKRKQGGGNLYFWDAGPRVLPRKVTERINGLSISLS